MRWFITFILLLASAVAVAQDFVVNLEDGVNDKELVYLLAHVPWQGAHEDPFAPMVRWSSELDSSMCFTEPPPGWSSALHAYEVTNHTTHPVALTLDGAVVDVSITMRAGSREQYPAVVIAKTSRGTERFTALPPGRTCYGILPYKDAEFLNSHMVDWRLKGLQLAHRGSRGTFVPVSVPVPGSDKSSTFFLYAAPVFSAQEHTETISAIKGRVRYPRAFHQNDFS